MRALKFMRAMVEDSILEPIVGRALRHDERAWRRFQEIIWPGLLVIAGRYRSSGPFAADEDARKDIAVIVLERFARNQFDVLERLHRVLVPGGDAGWRWTCRLTARKARDYARDHGDNLGPDSRGVPRFVQWIPLSPQDEELLPDSIREPDDDEAQRVMELAERILDPPQLRALLLHFAAEPDEAIAKALGLATAQDAHRLWQGGVGRLRYQLVYKAAPGGGERKK